MKIFHLSATVTAAAIALISGFSTGAIAREPDHLCFISTTSGEILDLSESLCGSKKTKFAKAAKTDQAFIDEYKRQALKYPAVRDNLLSSITSAPEDNIRQAKSVCQGLDEGLTLDEIAQEQARENNKAKIANAAIINDLAIKYYCPGMNN